MIPASLDEKLLAMLGGASKRLECPMLAAGCAPDHVHVVVRLASSVALGELVRQMKGATAFELNLRQALPRRFAWQDGYWAESLSPADLDTICRYVRGQRAHHDFSHPIEQWAAATST